MADVNSEDAEKDTVSQMARDAEEHGVQVTKAILQCMLNPDGENCVTEEISIEDLAREFADISDGDDDVESGEESEEDEVLGLQAQIECLKLARAVLQRNGNLTEECSRALFQC